MRKATELLRKAFRTVLGERMSDDEAVNFVATNHSVAAAIFVHEELEDIRPVGPSPMMIRARSSMRSKD